MRFDQPKMLKSRTLKLFQNISTCKLRKGLEVFFKAQWIIVELPLLGCMWNTVM